MKYLTGNAVPFLLCAGLLCGPAALADSIFTIENPDVDFQVIDAMPFDGIGDNGPYPTFGDVALGTTGAARSMAEFDISGFTVPVGEIIISAMYEVKFTSVGVFGLGINGEFPASLAVDGYVGDGVAQLSDFQIADGNVLDSVATPAPEVEDILRFSVTSFVTDLVNAGESYVGLTLRAETFGGDQFWESSSYPRLTIQTAVPEPATFALCALAGLPLLRQRRGT